MNEGTKRGYDYSFSKPHTLSQTNHVNKALYILNKEKFPANVSSGICDPRKGRSTEDEDTVSAIL
jgi:hypothetical protein